MGPAWRDSESIEADTLTHMYRGTSLIRNSPPPLGPPYNPRYSPSEGPRREGVLMSEVPLQGGSLRVVGFR